MTSLNLKPRKSPRQARSKLMVSLILEAATRVLQRESLAGFNTNRVAEVAGISVGSLYQYFPNKSALVSGLIDQAQTQIANALEQLVTELADAPLEEAIHTMAAYAVKQQYGDPLLAAALDHEERRLPVQARLREAEARMVAAVQRLLARHADRLPVGLPVDAARDLLVIAKALIEADADGGALPPPGLADRVARALYGYLMVDPPLQRQKKRRETTARKTARWPASSKKTRQRPSRA